MKVLLLPHRFAPLGVGGVERWAWTLSEAVARRGIEVAVLSRDDREGSPTAPFTLVEGGPAGLAGAPAPEGVSTFWITHRHADARVARDAWNDRRFDAPIDAVLDRVRPDVVHVAHVDGWGVVPFRRARRRGAVLGATLHDYKAVCLRGQMVPTEGTPCDGVWEERCVRCVSDQLRRGPLQALAGRLVPLAAHTRARARARPLADRRDPGPQARRRWRARQTALREALRGCDVLTAPSEFAAGVHRDAGLDRPVAVVRNAVPAGAALPPRAPGPLRVGFFGTDVPTKGLDVLLRAATAARIELHVHGPTPGPSASDVVWHGPYAPAEAVERMGTVDVVALPSRWPENAPLVALEARRARRPLMVSRVGGLPESVRDGVDGWVLPADDVGAWTGALERLKRDPEITARAGAAGPHPQDPDQLAERFVNLWSEAMEAKRAGSRCAPPG